MWSSSLGRGMSSYCSSVSGLLRRRADTQLLVISQLLALGHCGVCNLSNLTIITTRRGVTEYILNIYVTVLSAHLQYSCTTDISLTVLRTIVLTKYISSTCITLIITPARPSLTTTMLILNNIITR